MDKQVLSKVEEFYSKYPAREWPAKQILVQASDSPQGVYLIEKGGVRQYTIDYRGEEVVVNTFYPPSFFPMSWAVNNTDNEYFFETVDESVLRCAPREEVIRFVKNNPDVTLDLLTRIYSGLDGVLMRMVHLMSGSAYVRLLYELVIQAKRLKSDKTKNIFLPMKEYQLGTLSGLTRETVSREFKKLKDKNLIEVTQKSIVIVDLKRIEEELEKQI